MSRVAPIDQHQSGMPVWHRWAFGLHLGIALLVLLASVFAPRPGRAVLLLSLGSAPASGITQGWTLAGRGRLAGSLLVHAAGPVPVAALLRRGIVPLAVPEALCGGAR